MSGLGIPCPKCQGEARIIKSRRYGGVTSRWHYCKRCGHRFRSQEWREVATHGQKVHISIEE